MVSVVVPVWNDASCLDKLLNWLADEPGVLETIVVDAGSSDHTTEVASSFPGVRLISSPRGRGRQMNAGAAAANGDVLLFLHCDTIPARGSIAGLPDLLMTHRADFGAFRVCFDPPVFLPQAFAWLTRFAFSWTCFGDQGIFVRREFFHKTGGFPEIALIEDIRWARTAAKMGRMARSPHTAVTSARRFVEAGTLRQLWRNSSILVLDRLGRDPAALAGIYRGDRQREDSTRTSSEEIPKGLAAKAERG